ncbi:MAG: UDP-N-acetylmuramyl-tripeptide synthetase [Treponema sp.]|uniref:UDP-N-acetylmuramyl-tripeptide synthetase n=1 Tax=Treponema sp. TaxID=166 RepID=UPI00298DB520|nr:UDP-N-acetylmuramyl-tripeptide synthetase [Treponema sp.]MCR5386024.1 UDP-N-acetylmuramyl-tripeptide synthetase [Treponema sp.]
MEKKLSLLLSAINGKALACDGVTEQDLDIIGITPITDLVFDSRLVKPGALFFALPGHHTDGNRFIADAIERGANAVIYEGEIPHEEQLKIAKAVVKRGIEDLGQKQTVLPVFFKVDDAQGSMAPVSDAFYDSPSKKLAVIGVTGTEGKSSTVSFVWQLLRLAGHKAGFISTVQYSLGAEALANPQHTTTPEAPIVQKYLYEMVQNGCEYAVVESSSHGLSKKLNRLGNVNFDCGIFMNVTLEHLEFHKTFEQYKDDKANLFRALDENDHVKTINNVRQIIPSFGIVNLEDPECMFFAGCTKKNVFGFTTDGMAGKAAGESGTNAVPLPKIPDGFPSMRAKNIASARFGISFTVDACGSSAGTVLNADPALPREHKSFQVTATLPGAFNAYNIMASLIAVSGLTGVPFEELAKLVPELKPITGRMTTLDLGQSFEVIIDYAHTPSSFETVFPPLKKRCDGRIFALFGSGGERDLTKRPLQGEIAGKWCDVVVLADEDPRGEDPHKLLEDIAVGARKSGKKDGIDLFIIPDRPTAIRRTFEMAKKGDIVLLLGKGHENSIIYKDFVMPYDEIEEAKKALQEILK